MSALSRTLAIIGKNIIFPEFRRSFTLAPVNRFKEIIERKEGNTLIVEAKIVPDPGRDRLFEGSKTKACPLCSLGLDVKYTDVLILSQFLRSDGCLLPKRITGLCGVQQKRVEYLVAMAQKAGLMPNLTPEKSKRDPKQRYGWKRYNQYYDETTIPSKFVNVTYRE